MFMFRLPSAGTSWRGMPDRGESPDDLVKVGVLAMFSTVFLALLGQGCPPREALALTLALGAGSAQVTRRTPGRRDDGHGRDR